MLTIEDIMTPYPITVDVSTSVSEVKNIMTEQSIRHIPVIENGKLAGIISDRDLKLSQAVADDQQFNDRIAGAICLRTVYTVQPTEHAKKVLAYMGKMRIGSAMVVDNDKLVGIFTAVDACKAFAGYLSRHDK